MPEAVIVDAVRTPIGRAFKGSLAQLRPDETGAFIVDQLLERNPDVDPASVEDVICGCGMPQGLQAFNIGRIIVAALREARRRDHRRRPSRATAPRASTRSEQAANAVKAGQGDTYIAAGVEWVSPLQRAPGGRRRRPTRTSSSRARTASPNAYIAMGADGRERGRQLRGQPRRHGQVRPALAGARREVAGGRLLRPRDRAGHAARRHRGREGRRPARQLDAREARLSSTRPSSEDGKVTAGNSCPLNDGAAAALIMSDDKAKELGLKPRARIITAATWGNEPEYMGVAPIGAIKKVLERAGMTIERRRQGRAERGVRRPGDPDHGRVRHPAREDEPARRRDRPRPPVRDDRRADHDHAAQRPRDRRQADRPRDDVRRRRPGRGDDRRAAELDVRSRLAPGGRDRRFARTKPAISSASRSGWSSDENVRASSIHSRRASARSRASRSACAGLNNLVLARTRRSAPAGRTRPSRSAASLVSRLSMPVEHLA